ncbi:hypothetical protein A3A46_03305 [Candidatus Roizmanbacteria bacterium RIFCSPLOWO2_01_FULL_37_13]|uniref:Uncharacterized protein n=1 Tax=Candidatus Roizmanbacteria bacterium RIFCSPHIGHO2_02_FULL_38_11 TaxID=1802039 RepID=A0A1F7GWH5_9BACT|nr:MAG: hypothetical protein A3C25_02140 [Candidatus Roizmanbacteria bacterium RIFCSPHIGHO2_02_FULL_38_11]OGK34540.1 MAG: hypothetical protein A3F58_00425 [Candidatus Roizmanbacteria bacterium RIFCSPHIGHO2_12_FULL_37_9b]OGK43159.1 MAG: hypothetical protein A3A46_03305 [Candidatus Roizmanbacteria bacterium RIFCSPLOWO2_01_FULL_37_13]
MVQDASQVEGKNPTLSFVERAKAGVKRVLKRQHTPLPSDLQMTVEPVPQMPPGVDLRLESLQGDEVLDPGVRAELSRLAPVALQVHQEMMVDRQMQMLRESGLAIPVLLGESGTSSDLLAKLEEKVKADEAQGEVFEQDKLDLMRSALKEASTQWQDIELRVSRDRIGDNISDISVTQRTDTEDRQVHYWVRNISNTPSFLTDDFEHRVDHDDEFRHGWRYEPVILGKRSKEGNFERIGPSNQVRRDAKSLGESPGEYLKQAGFAKTYMVELQSVGKARPTDKV